VRRLNRYVEEQAPWKLAKDPERAPDLDRTLASLAEGLRVLAVLLHAYLPESTATLLDALGAPDTSLDAALFGHCGGSGETRTIDPLFPKQ
jgi:methionyl-tRNA synthetase